MKTIRQKKRILSIILLVNLVIAFACASSSVKTDIDVNSVRLRDRVFVFGIMISVREFNTFVEEELKRLSLASEPPEWRYMGVDRPGLVGLLSLVDSGLGRGAIGSIMADCGQLLTFFDIYNANDQERRMILSNVMQMLKKGDYRAIDRIMYEYADSKDPKGAP
jgi:hypothetical protein